MKVLVFLLKVIGTAIAITVLEQTCQTFPYYFYHGHSCFIPSSYTREFAKAKLLECQTPNLPIGHLAYILTQETINAWIKAESDGKCPSSGAHYVGLEQIPGNDESEGGSKGWTWIHPNLPNRPTPHHDMIIWNWDGDHPHDFWFDTDDAGVMDATDGGIVDANGVLEWNFLCEYEEPTLRMYHRCHRDKIGHNTTLIAEYEGLSRIDCGQKCANDLMCRSLSFNQVTGHCVIHWTDGGVTNFEPIQKNGYEFFVSHYSYNKTLASFPLCTAK